eukprot:CAMPEP_0196803124 /NCGR_PEP_ID=MMETSP1362-20130617/2547_1 /TAXON_ID=163516 /ORGANISM="Leptocylindrus danicus, Strain CCMP1856" /LENGTH=218 /DNA_ID=CAMNT_0042174567 /DNA_START=378 /DNA_END=1034 /DNA_ORIENTATION=-
MKSPFASSELCTPSSAYVPGVGFSGFWYTIGALQSIQALHEMDFFCYSAGCLAVTVALSNRTITDVSDIAFGLQQRWRSNNISRWDIVEHFVDDILKNDSLQVLHQNVDANLLERMNVLTTTKEGSMSVRKAQNISDLKDLLIQTTWIPFATGWGLSKDGHLDGGFSSFVHPICGAHFALPMKLAVFVNVLNPALNQKQVEQLWRSGVGNSVQENCRA